MQALVYFLLPDKSKATYNRVFAMLKEYALSVGKVFQPTTVQLDFEVACLNAIQESFPGAGVKGCDFHFCQALWRKAQELGLQPYYGDRAVNRFLKCVAASVWCSEEIDEAWLQIDGDSPSADHPAFQALDRFKTNFGARTTNHIEDWHHALNGRVGKRHVNLFEIVSHLQKEEHGNKAQRLLLDMGRAPKPVRKKYRVLNERLIRLTDQYEAQELSLIQYASRVAHNLYTD
ncbi:uncharacterized protein LOC108863729 [Galendromus occidentalis]|uniref:Uncharacterized protein LOC108863729 n=1 Tax=Galendromus occidentalis TaxID=34638 RepID=A0AAJ7WGN5_9ACAR|nr:uncharacterized protein LOC108863729 [Galendromus occidentalis]